MTTAADPRIYPAARKGRGAGVVIEDLGPITAPRMRVMAFAFISTATSRRSLSFGPFTGPCIVKDVEFYHSSFTAGYANSLEVGKNTIPVTEAGVALATARPYTRITELIDPFNVAAADSGQGIPDAGPPSRGFFQRSLNIVVTDPEIYIILAWINPGLNAETFTGELRVLEGVDPEALRFFL
jgi:hypothetical protein